MQHEVEMKTKLQNPGQITSITSQRKQTVASYLNDWVESYAGVNLHPSTYDGYKRTIANYITPYIGGVALNQITPAMVDKMFQQIIDKGLKPFIAAGAKRVLSVALSHARKYRYIETNAAKDILTKFGKGDKTPNPYTTEQVNALMQRVEVTLQCCCSISIFLLAKFSLTLLTSITVSDIFITVTVIEEGKICGTM